MNKILSLRTERRKIKKTLPNKTPIINMGNYTHVNDDSDLSNYARGLMKKLGKANYKQEDKEAWDSLIDKMSIGMKIAGLSKKEIEFIISDLLQLSAYSFNRSHAYAYTYLGVQTSYLSTYFKQCFYSTVLETSTKEEIQVAAKKVVDYGFKILPPDVNSSKYTFAPTGSKVIRFGLSRVMGVGDKAIKSIIENRPYASIQDFIIKNLKSGSGITKAVTNGLICSGSFDEIIGEENRKFYENVAIKFYTEKKKTIKTPELLLEKWEEAVKETEVVQTTNEDLIEYEKKYLGGLFFHCVFSDEVLKKITTAYSKGYCLMNFEDIRDRNLPNAMVPVNVKKFRTHIDKNGNEMLFAEIEDCTGEGVSIPIFASNWKQIKDRFDGEGIYFMSLFSVDGDIKFGSKSFLDDKRKARMIIKFPTKES